MTIRQALPAIVAALVLAHPSVSWSAEYRADICTPAQAGQPNGWILETNSGPLHTMQDNCHTGGPLNVGFDGRALTSWNGFQYGRAALTIPGTARITEISMDRSASARAEIPPLDEGGTVEAGLYARFGAATYTALDTLSASPGQAPTVSGGRVITPSTPLDAGALVIRGVCHVAADACREPQWDYRVDRLSITLDDATGPQGWAGGPLALDPWLSGTKSVTITAQDAGIGVGTAEVLVDGTVVASSRLAADCPADRSSTTPVYIKVRPCPGTGETTLQFDTATIADGERLVQVVVSDELGNRTTVLERTALIANTSAPSIPSGPVPASLPLIAGEARVGQALTVTVPVFAPQPEATIVRWLRCNTAGEDCRAVRGASGERRIVNPADQGMTLRAEVLATASDTTTSTRSAPTPVIEPEASPAQGGEATSVLAVTTPDILTRVVSPTDAHALTLRLLAPTRTQVRRGTRILIGGQTRTHDGALKAGVRVRIQKRGARGWRTVTSAVTRRNGTFTTSLIVRERTRLRAIADGLRTSGTVASLPVTINPRRAR